MKATRIPIVTLILIVANLVAAFALVWNPNVLTKFGFDPLYPSFQTALTSLFLHANTMHLLGNMVFLAAVGPAVESALNSWKFALVYFLGGLAGVAVHWTLVGRALTETPLVGASGAIAACVGLFSVRFFRVRVPVAPGISMPVVAVTGIWLGLQVLGAFIKIGATEGGMAYWAHIGGFVGGLLLGVVFRSTREANQEHMKKTIDEMGDRSPAAVVAVADSHLKDNPRDPVALEERAEALHLLGDHEKEAETWIALLEIQGTGDQAATIQRLAACGGLEDLPVLRRLRLADELRSGDPEVSAQLLESVVSNAEESPELPDAMLSLAEIQRESAPERAQELINEIFDRFPLHPAADLARAKGWKP